MGQGGQFAGSTNVIGSPKPGPGRPRYAVWEALYAAWETPLRRCRRASQAPNLFVDPICSFVYNGWHND